MSPIRFFFSTDEIRTLYSEFQNTYEHVFEAVEDIENIPLGKVYFTTPSDLNNHVYNIHQQFKDKYKDSIRAIDNQKVVTQDIFPVDIGFKQNLEVALKPFEGRKEPLKVAIINAMSNAIGDHLIGMRAFDVWVERVEEHLGVPVEVSFFQMNPMRLGPITSKREQLKNIYVLPNKLMRLVENDAYINLASLLLRENFDTQPMVDFFLEALSIPPNSVPHERKRIKFTYDPNVVAQMTHVMNVIRTKKRPVLLFHHRSTSAVREMLPIRARQVLKQILDKTDYFVVSAMDLEFQHERFLDISRFSKGSLWNFAALIDMVDAVITVDTSTYHFADAFDTPTVALFTTIEPDKRVRYYPFVDSIMLERPGGDIYGLHKAELDPELLVKQLEYTDSVWQRLNIDDMLNRLDSMILKQKEVNYERCNSSRGAGNETIPLNESDKQMPVASVQQANDLLPDTDLGGGGNQ